MTTRRSAVQVETVGKTFREAWIPGVKKYYPGEPKHFYFSHWDETPEWEMPEWQRKTDADIFERIEAAVHERK